MTTIAAKYSECIHQLHATKTYAGCCIQVLNFEDAEFTESDGPLPQLYQGINLFCPSGTCGYVRETSYPAWTANSAPNSMFFYINGYPTIAAANGGLLRLKSLYCSQAEGYVVNLLAIGTIVGVVSLGNP